MHIGVEINPTVDYSDLTKFGRIYPAHVEASTELRSQIEALEDEQGNINETYQDAEEFPPDVDKRMAEIEERIEELNEQAKQYREEEKKLAGAVVSIESIHRGLVRPEDKRKAEAAQLGGATGDPTGEGEEPQEEVELSAALVEDLTAHRTAALRAVLATRPEVALVAVTHALALQVCYEASCHYDAGSALSLTTDKGGCRLDSHAKDG
jgi:ParB family transcriptional regulator, chromosome partitioning protein